MYTQIRTKPVITNITHFIAVFFVSIALMACASSAKDESTGEYIDNTVITTKVKAALLKSPIAEVLEIKVKSHKGVVQLSGFVDTYEQKAEAEKIARNTDGVHDVENAIIVK